MDKRKVIGLVTIIVLVVIVGIVIFVSNKSKQTDESENIVTQNVDTENDTEHTIITDSYDLEIDSSDVKLQADSDLGENQKEGQKIESPESKTDDQKMDTDTLIESKESESPNVNKNPEEIREENNNAQGVINSKNEAKEKSIDNEGNNKGEDLTEEEHENNAIQNTDQPLLYAEDQFKRKNEKNVEVMIKIKNNPGILGMMISVYYDESKMKIKGAENGEAFDGVLSFTNSNELKSGSRYIWDGQELLQDDIKDGTVLKLEFEMLDDSSIGKYPITLICNKDDVVDKDLKPIDIDVINGNIIVQ